MKLGLGLTMLAGLILAIALIAYQGAGEVAHAVASASWGILVLSVFHLLPLTCSALGWRAVLRHTGRGSLGYFLFARWVREHAAHLLPVLQVGGEVIGARLLTFRGLAPGVAGGHVVVDLTLEAATQLLFTLLGVMILVVIGNQPDLVRWMLLGLFIATLSVAAFLLAQHRGLFLRIEDLLERAAKRNQRFSLGRIDNLHETILALYRDRTNVLAGSCYHFLCLGVGCRQGMACLVLHGPPDNSAGGLDARKPGQLGVQEGGYMLLGGLIGLGPELGLALSLIKRVRALLLGLPALLAWQIMESRRLLTNHQNAPSWWTPRDMA